MGEDIAGVGADIVGVGADEVDVVGIYEVGVPVFHTRLSVLYIIKTIVSSVYYIYYLDHFFFENHNRIVKT